MRAGRWRGCSRMMMMRGAGLLLVRGGACAALVALVTYHADDASLNNANGRDVANLLGPLGAVAADLLLQTFGFAALRLSGAACLSGALRAVPDKIAEPCHVAAGGLAAGHPDRRGGAGPFSRARQLCPPAWAA